VSTYGITMCPSVGDASSIHIAGDREQATMGEMAEGPGRGESGEPDH
jgi:hypothetical protein